MASSLTEYDVFSDSTLNGFCELSFDPNYASLFGMLQVKSMAFRYFPINGLFDPSYRVNDLVAPYFFHQMDCKGVFGINGPYNEQSSIFL